MTDTAHARTVHGLFETQARRTPEAVAVETAQGTMTYAELDRRAGHAARTLAAAGLGPDRICGLLLEHTADIVVGMLGVLKAGGAYLPLDPKQPAARRTALLADAAAAAVLTTRELRAALPPGGPAAVLLDEAPDQLADAGRVDGGAGPENLAYLLYTSGSTGRPKGVMVEHRNVLGFLDGIGTRVDLGPGVRMLQFAGISFDATICEIFGTLGRGGTIVALPPDVERGGPGLLDFLERARITFAMLPPSLLAVLPDRTLPELRTLIVGGETVPASVVERWGAGRRFLVGYGPTETTLIATTGEEPRPAGRPPIGHPLPGVAVHVLGPDLLPVAPGEPGEIHIGGGNLARGYLGAPALTAERFVPDPFGAPGARLYRTGDLARVLPDGQLEFLGRTDAQIKLRGHRIELGEVEAALSALEGVKDCAVLAVGEGADAALVAFTAGDRTDPDAMLAQLAARLPGYMIPAVLVPLPTLPVAAHGAKTDRAALRERAADALAGRGAGADPVGPVEQRLAAIWCDVLGVPFVGRDAGFPALGGNSLQALAIVARIADEFGTRVGLPELFGGGTVARLAELVGAGGGHPAWRLEPSAGAPGGLEPASLGQQRLWFLAQRPGAATAYTIPILTALRGPVDADALRAALVAETRAQEALRTGFELRDGNLVAVVRPEAEVDFATVDLSGDAEPDAAAERLARELARQPFELAAPPLLRMRLIRVGAQRHLLVTVLAHIIADGWSVDMLDRRLAARYRGETPNPPSVRYGDFAAWQRRLADSDALEQGLSYWRETLAGVPRQLALPYDLPRPRQQSFTGARVSVTAPAGLAAQVAALARAESTTSYTVFLAALGALLHGLGGQQSLLVGSPVAGRPSAQLDETAGFFANTVPVRLDAARGQSFRDLLAGTSAHVLAAFEHQYVPFEWLVKEHAAEREDSRPPLVQAVLAYQGRRRPNAELAGAACVPLPADNATAKFDLVLEIEEVPDGVALTVEYSADVFLERTARRMLDWYLRLLEAALADPGAALGRLAFLEHDELAILPARRPSRDPDRCLHELFAARAAAVPDAVAVTDGGRQVTYGELDRSADALARRLARAGAAPGGLVGVCAERGADLVVAILAVLKSGSGYVPFDPTHPGSRIRGILEDSGCDLVVGHGRFARLFSGGGPRFVAIDDAPQDPAAEETDAADGPDGAVRTAGPADIAYVIYTSGSTGRPKGVMVSHANAVRLFDATAPQLRPTAEDVWTLFHSAAFDFSVWELWGPLLHGGRLVIVPYAVSRDPEAFLHLLIAERVTVLNQTPSAFRGLVAAAGRAGYPATALRRVVFGGERLEPALLKPWVEAYGDASPLLVNMYGITETTVHVTSRDLAAADLSGSNSPIGPPLDDLRLYLLDEDLEPVPVGVPGEIHVGGPGVSYGYLGRAALSAERFVPDPHGAPGTRMYRSGDLAILRPDGELVFLGRADDQVQLRGFRVEPGEIEAALLGHPAVRQAAVLLRPDEYGEPRLVAYLVTDGAPPTSDDLRAELAGRLPGYMVPSDYAAVRHLPLTANGKLDRHALPDPRAAALLASGPRAGYTAPRGENERLLAEVWQEALGADRVGVHDDFFALGGDSIVAIRVVAGARRAGLELGIEQLYQAPTVAGVAQLCGTTAVPATGTGTEPAGRGSTGSGRTESGYPCSAMQRGILYECEISGDPTLYHDLVSVRLEGPCDPKALRRALGVLSTRHEVLRTSFDLDAFPVPLQHVHRTAAIPMSVSSSDGDAGEALRDWWLERWHQGFDFAQAPLARCDVLLHEDATFDLALSVHHSVIDGWSLSILITDLLCAYENELGGDAPLPAVPLVRFRDFVELERAAAESAASAEFWQGRATGTAAEALPVGAPDEAADIEPDVRIDVPDDLVARARRAADGLGVPPKSVMLAAHLWALGALTGQPSAVTGSVFNGRPEEPDAELVAGLFLNCLPIGADLPGGTWRDLVTEVFAAERAAVRHRRYPLAELRARVKRAPFQVMFNYADFHGLRRLAGLSLLTPLDWWFSDRTDFPLDVEFARRPLSAGFTLAVRAGAGVPAATAQRMARLYLRALTELTADPDARYPVVGHEPGQGTETAREGATR